MISGAGVCCLDYIMMTPRPEWGGSAPIRQYCVQGGGLVATALVACARLGARTQLFSLLGEDDHALRILTELEDEGVAASGVARIPGWESPFSIVHVDSDSGERTIFHRGAGGRAWPGGDLSAIAGSDVLLVDHCFPDLTRAAIAVAKSCGAPVVADTQPAPSNLDWLKGVDVLIAPGEYARRPEFRGDLAAALRAIRDCGPRTAVITLGADGWIALDDTGFHKGPAFKVRIVDTLGAGDVFHGAYAFARARGWDAPRCCEFASAVAAIKCEQVGGRTGIPSFGKALAFLRERGTGDWSELA